MLMRLFPFEPLEPRRLFAADLTPGNSTFPQVVQAGETITPFLTVNNFGDADNAGEVNTPFTITWHLVPYAFGKQGGDFSDITFDDPKAVNIGSTVDSDPVHVNQIGVNFVQPDLKIPANIAPGTYEAIAKIDCGNKIIEKSE